jgi:hypothetical protein
MAMCFKRQNGIWSNWQIAKIKGENGIDGRNGTDGSDGTNGLNGNKYEYVYYRNDGTSPVLNKRYGTYSKEGASTRTRVEVVPETEDFFPAADTINSLNGGSGVYWSDHPQGVDDTYTHE